MDGPFLVRARWRVRGAWMWPAFVVLAVVDAYVGHRLPALNDSQSVFGCLVVALLLNLVAVVVLAWPAAAVLRRLRRDMPWSVARNYGGTGCVMLVTAGFVVFGVIHHTTVVANRAAMHDAVERAAAYIGARAPAQFRAEASHTDTYVIQTGVVYRTCVLNRAGTRDWCVVVNEHTGDVTPAGSEPNSVLALGTN